MSHKSAKRARKMLNQIMKPKENGTPLHLERQYTENVKNRKKQEVELRSGEIKKIDVAYGTMRVNMDTGRGAYKMIKRALAGKTAAPRSALKQLETPSKMGERLQVIPAGPDASEAKVYDETGALIEQ